MKSAGADGKAALKGAPPPPPKKPKFAALAAVTLVRSFLLPFA
jgi:hypothetical protein